jgi:hypothetical protein
MFFDQWPWNFYWYVLWSWSCRNRMWLDTKICSEISSSPTVARCLAPKKKKGWDFALGLTSSWVLAGRSSYRDGLPINLAYGYFILCTPQSHVPYQYLLLVEFKLIYLRTTWTGIPAEILNCLLSWAFDNILESCPNSHAETIDRCSYSSVCLFRFTPNAPTIFRWLRHLCCVSKRTRCSARVAPLILFAFQEEYLWTEKGPKPGISFLPRQAPFRSHRLFNCHPLMHNEYHSFESSKTHSITW